jgi:hypothetical protein
MTDLNKLLRLAGVPLDLSKVNNAKTTIITPKHLQELNEAAKVPEHRGEISPKNKKNMRGRVSCAKKALEFLEQAREELMSIPAIDYEEDIPDVIRQLHKMLHGEDGTGGLHGAHRKYERDYNDMEFPEDLENKEPGKDGNPTEEELKAREKESLKKKAENEKKSEKKPVKESTDPAPEKAVKSDGLGFAKAKNDPADGKSNVRPFKLAPNSDVLKDTMYMKDGKVVGEDPRTRTPKPDTSVQEEVRGLVNPLVKAEVDIQKKEGKISQQQADQLEMNPEGHADEQEEETPKKKHKPTWLTNAEQRAEDHDKKKKVAEANFGLSLGSSTRERSVRSATPSDAGINPEAKRAAQLAGIKPNMANPFGKSKSEQEENTPHSVHDLTNPNKPRHLGTFPSRAAAAAHAKAHQRASVGKNGTINLSDLRLNRAGDPGEKVSEASGPLFARDAEHPKHVDGDSQSYPSWSADDKKPVNVVSSDDGVSLYYPNGSKSENANQLSSNPYNESQKVNVPAKIKSALKTEADTARKLAETFEMRKDWDSKNFHENMANAFDTLNNFLEKGTIYGIKEAQIFMTSLMSPYTNKLPADVIKYIAAGGTVRSLKSYINDVKEPVTGSIFRQDSDGTK